MDWDKFFQDVSPLFLLALGGGVLLTLLLLLIIKRKSLRGTGRYATLSELSFRLGNWTEYPLSLVGTLILYLVLAITAGVALFQRKGLDPFKELARLGLAALVLLMIAIFLYRYLSLLFFTKPNSYPIGEVGPAWIGARQEISLSEKHRFEHVLIQGRAGAGKTDGFMFPGLLRDAEGNCSAVVLDVKAPEIFNTIAGWWHRRKKNVIVFDPYHPDCVGFEPLSTATKETIARLEEAIYGKRDTNADPQTVFFDDQERRLFRLGCQLIQTYKDPRQCNLPMLYQLASRGVRVLEEAVNYCRNDRIIQEFDTFFQNRQRIPDLLAGMLNKLDLFSDPKIAAAFSRSDLDLDLLFREPTLFIIASPQSNPKARLAASILLRAIMLKVYEHPVRQKGDGLPVFLYLDEFYNLYLPEMPDFVNTARSARVGVITLLQSDVQLEQYKRHEKGSLKINRKMEVYFPGCDIETCENLSKRIGKTLTSEKRFSRSPMRGRTTMHGQIEVPLLTPDEIQNLEDDLALCFVAGVRPFLVKRLKAHKMRRFKKKMNLPAIAYRPNTDPLVPPTFKDLPEVPSGPASPPPGWPKSPSEAGGLYQF